MRCAFGQLRKPNHNPNLTLTLKLTVTQTLILPLTILQVCCTIDQILHNSSNAVQLINWSAVQHLIKCATEQMHTSQNYNKIRLRLFVRVRTNSFAIHMGLIARLFIRTHMVIVTGYSYGSIYTTGDVTIRWANLTLTLTFPIGKPTASYCATYRIWFRWFGAAIAKGCHSEGPSIANPNPT